MSMQVLRAVPKGARLLLECAGAVVAAAPSKFKVCHPSPCSWAGSSVQLHLPANFLIYLSI